MRATSLIHTCIHTYIHTYITHRRTDEGHKSDRKQGVSSPSQKRYVGYIEKIVLYNVDYVSTKPLVLNKVCMYVCMLFWSHTHRKDGSV